MKKTKRILALIGVVLLIALYLVTLILAFFASPATKGWLMASLACTIVGLRERPFYMREGERI